MIIPIRCMSCGKPLGHLWEEYNKRIQKEDKGEVMTDLGITRYCCRTMFLGQVDLIDVVAEFKKF